jgi:hypothetical protein
VSAWTPKERAELIVRTTAELLHSDFIWRNLNNPVDAAFIFAEQLVKKADPSEAGPSPLPPPRPRPDPEGGAA